MKSFLLLILFGAISLLSEAQMNVWFDRPNPSVDTFSLTRYDADSAWENASLPIGNGSLGANVMGSVAIERLTLNEKSLWRGGPGVASAPAYYWQVNKSSAPWLDTIRQSFLQGDSQRAAYLTGQHFSGLAAYEPGGETPFRFGSYTTMGELLVYTGIDEKTVIGYRRTLSLDSALVRVAFQSRDIHYTRHFFASYSDSLIVCSFGASVPGSQHLTVIYRPNPQSHVEPERLSHNEVLYRCRLRDNGMAFAVRMRCIAQGGTVEVDSTGAIHVSGADHVMLLLAGDTDYAINFNPDFRKTDTYVGIDPVQSTQQTIRRAGTSSYGQLLQRHLDDYVPLFGRFGLSLNPHLANIAGSLPTPKRLALYRQGGSDYGLEQLYVQYGRYLLIASSRQGNLPANLQGMWSRAVDGPWRVDYHNNVNLQMNYWIACPANLMECHQPLSDYIRSLVEPGKVTARAYYDARGWTASISSNIFGFTAPLASSDMTWNLSPMAGPWLATHMWDYFLFSRDTLFLSREAYPVIRESACFAADILWHRPDGFYTVCPSTSPEHGPVDQGATFANAVAREILQCAISASRLLHVDHRLRRQWQHALNHIMPYRVGRYGQLMEWSADIDDPDDTHRHLNHLFGLHPGTTISPLTTPHLAQASEMVLRHRGDGATGWSMGWKINQWARLHRGEEAYKLFGNLLRYGTLDNLWDSHPPFQIDGNFGGSAGVLEMLLQSHMGEVHLLPALPQAWQQGRVNGIMARGGFELDICWQQGVLTEAVVLSHAGGRCQVRYRGHTLSFHTLPGSTYRLRYGQDTLQLVH